VPISYQPVRNDTVKRQHIVAIVLAASSYAALAQTAIPSAGDWKANWQYLGRPLQAKLVISGSGGTWQSLSSLRTDPCVGREVPMSIESSSVDEITLKLKYSESLRGCADATIVLKRIDDKTYMGKRGDGDLKLSKD
jgi:hypothetical protein